MMRKRIDSTEILTPGIVTHDILGLDVAVTSIGAATNYILMRAVKDPKGYVCAANVHMCMESYDDREFRQVVNSAELIVPDGKPLFWWMRAFGIRSAQQVRGPDLFLSVCDASAGGGVSVALYGGSEKALELLQNYLRQKYHALNVVKAISPPFRVLSEDEKNSYISEINRSGARILFVGLGCPKQEKWMALHRESVNAIMVGVGAAFDFYAGTINIAPEWVRNLGLEWLHRLYSEPRRLWKRYLWNNPRFVFLFVTMWCRKFLSKRK